MRLQFEASDGRSWNHRSIVDQDTGKEVGYIRSNGAGPYNFGGIEISLFDSKYCRTVNRDDQCWGFVKGVEAVLNHMTSMKEKSVTERDTEAA